MVCITRTILATAGLLFVGLDAARAQKDTAFQVLAVPAGTVMRCHPTTSNALGREAGDVAFRFELGGVPPAASRTIDVVFDSVGAPRALRDAVVDPSAGALILDAITARFGPDGSVAGFHPRNAASDSASRSRSEFISLSSSEKNRARMLVQWLWAHRCQNGSASSETTGGQFALR